MSGRLTTHVLDTASGRPAVGMRIVLNRVADSGDREAIADVRTNADGRVDDTLLAGASLVAGEYELVFHVAAYFASIGHDAAGRFLGAVPIVFTIDRPGERYHVPLLVTPWSYSTYRGS
ncbi:MAG: hydroxyisourate hydrolase [Planctomycetota bacterium]